MTPAHRRLASWLMPDPRPSRQIHAAVKQRVADGTYQPGDRVHVGLLADEFGVTRTTVGKALKLAEADGLIQFFTGVGWYVAGDNDT